MAEGHFIKVAGSPNLHIYAASLSTLFQQQGVPARLLAIRFAVVSTLLQYIQASRSLRKVERATALVYSRPILDVSYNNKAITNLRLSIASSVPGTSD